MNEAEFLSQVVKLAHMYGWLCSHQRPAWTSKGFRTALQGDPGALDLLLAHPERGLIFAELKVGKNKPTKAQEKWLWVLNEIAVSASHVSYGSSEPVAFPVRVYVWRETQLQEIADILAGKKPRV